MAMLRCARLRRRPRRCGQMWGAATFGLATCRRRWSACRQVLLFLYRGAHCTYQDKMEALRTDVGCTNRILLADLLETVDCLQARHVCQTYLPVLKCTQNLQDEAEMLHTEAGAATCAWASCRRQWSACKQDSAASARRCDISGQMPWYAVDLMA